MGRVPLVTVGTEKWRRFVDAQQYKVVLVGDGAAGRTTYVKEFRPEESEEKYVPTLGAEAYPLELDTSHGVIVFNVWGHCRSGEAGRAPGRVLRRC